MQAGDHGRVTIERDYIWKLHFPCGCPETGVGKTKPTGSIRNEFQMISLCDKRRYLRLSGISCESDDSCFDGWFKKGDKSPYKREGRDKLVSTSLGNVRREGEGEGMWTD